MNTQKPSEPGSRWRKLIDNLPAPTKGGLWASGKREANKPLAKRGVPRSSTKAVSSEETQRLLRDLNKGI